MFYGNAEEYRKYHTERGRELPETLTDEQISAALLVASEWLDARYSFSGFKTGGREQQRQWPRTNAYTNSYPVYFFKDNQVPSEIEKATYEVALRQLNSPDTLTTDYTPSKYKSVSVSGAVSVEYAIFSGSSDTQTQIQIVDDILHDIVTSENADVSGKVDRV